MDQDQFVNAMIDPDQAGAHLHGYLWAPGDKQAREFGPARDMTVFSGGSPDRIVVVNPISEQLRFIKESIHSQASGAPVRDEKGTVIEEYAVPSGRLLRRTVASIGRISLVADTGLVPVALSPHGDALYGVIPTPPAASAHVTSGVSLAKIDLSNGSVRLLTSTDEADQLLSRTITLYGVPFSASVAGLQIGCILDAPQRNLAYRFQYFDMSAGRLTRELKASNRDAARAGIPSNGTPITLTPAGDALVQAGDAIWLFQIRKASSFPQADRRQDLWLYKMGKATGKRIAEGITVNAVVGWSGSHLLVMAESTDTGKTRSPKVTGNSSHTVWAFVDAR